MATYQYGPFGEVLGVYFGNRAASCPFRYQTRLYDNETGLVATTWKRYYDAEDANVGKP